MSREQFPYHQLKFLQIVHELHRMGYQKLRVFPYEGPQFWRCALLSINNIDFENQHFPIDEKKAIRYSEAGGYRYFEWEDCENMSPFDLASRFARENSEFLRDCQGSDPAYVQWFVELLGFAAAGELPAFGGKSFGDYSNLGNVLGRELLNPPLPETSDLGRTEADPQRDALDLLLAVHELHRRGYQKLRAICGMSPSGCFYRISLAPRDFMTSDIETSGVYERLVLRYSSADRQKYFGLEGEFSGSHLDLADLIEREHAPLMRECLGSDWEYAGWFVEMLWFAGNGSFPVQFADWYETPRFAAEFGGRSLPFPPGPWSE